MGWRATTILFAGLASTSKWIDSFPATPRGKDFPLNIVRENFVQQGEKPEKPLPTGD